MLYFFSHGDFLFVTDIGKCCTFISNFLYADVWCCSISYFIICFQFVYTVFVRTVDIGTFWKIHKHIRGFCFKSDRIFIQQIDIHCIGRILDHSGFQFYIISDIQSFQIFTSVECQRSYRISIWNIIGCIFLCCWVADQFTPAEQNTVYGSLVAGVDNVKRFNTWTSYNKINESSLDISIQSYFFQIFTVGDKSHSRSKRTFDIQFFQIITVIKLSIFNRCNTRSHIEYFRSWHIPCCGIFQSCYIITQSYYFTCVTLNGSGSDGSYRIRGCIRFHRIIRDHCFQSCQITGIYTTIFDNQISCWILDCYVFNILAATHKSFPDLSDSFFESKRLNRPIVHESHLINRYNLISHAIMFYGRIDYYITVIVPVFCNVMFCNCYLFITSYFVYQIILFESTINRKRFSICCLNSGLIFLFCCLNSDLFFLFCCLCNRIICFFRIRFFLSICRFIGRSFSIL